ncbi:hypothetical protein GALL_423160 [mine drainage metagenome]|uniref:Uncharacterized protein n=1 Tax=mine drainage metagenome TaxID=410659 RepID=A0A1J5Q808_9ZZZZ
MIFFIRGAVDLVHHVAAHHGIVGRDHHGFQAIDLVELECLGVGCAGHASQLAIHAEIILEGDRRQRLVLLLNRHAFLGFDRLMQAVGPAAARHHATGKLVHDDNLAILHHVVLVAMEQRQRPQCGIQMMHQTDVGGIVQVGACQDARCHQQRFRMLVSGLGQQHLLRFLVHPEIAFALFFLLAGQLERNGVDGGIELHAVFGLAGNDQRRTRLVDQD